MDDPFLEYALQTIFEIAQSLENSQSRTNSMGTDGISCNSLEKALANSPELCDAIVGSGGVSAIKNYVEGLAAEGNDNITLAVLRQVSAGFSDGRANDGHVVETHDARDRFTGVTDVPIEMEVGMRANGADLGPLDDGTTVKQGPEEELPPDPSPYVQLLFELAGCDARSYRRLSAREIMATLTLYPELVSLLSFDTLLPAESTSGTPNAGQSRLPDLVDLLIDACGKHHAIGAREIDAFCLELDPLPHSEALVVAARLLFRIADRSRAGIVPQIDISQALSERNELALTMGVPSAPLLNVAGVGADAPNDASEARVDSWSEGASTEGRAFLADNGDELLTVESLLHALQQLHCPDPLLMARSDSKLVALRRKLRSQSRSQRIHRFYATLREALEELGYHESRSLPKGLRLSMSKGQRREAVSRHHLLDAFDFAAGFLPKPRATHAKESALAAMRFVDSQKKREAAKAFRRSHSVQVNARSMLATSAKRGSQKERLRRGFDMKQTGTVKMGNSGKKDNDETIRNRNDGAFKKRDRVTLIAFLKAINKVHPYWWRFTLQEDLIHTWKRCSGDIARFLDDIYMKPHESVSVGRMGFANTKLLNHRPYFAATNPAMESKTYNGPFPSPKQIAKEAQLGVAEALSRFEIPSKIWYHPGRSMMRPYPSFSPRDIARSARPPDRSLDLQYVFGFETEAVFGSNLIALDESTILYSVSALVVLHNVEDNTQKYFLGHDGQVSTLAISKSGQLVASGQSSARPYFLVWSALDGVPKTWTYRKEDERLHRMRLGFSVPLCAPSVLSIAFSPDEKFIAAIGADSDHMLGIWSLASGDLLIEKGVVRSTPPGVTALVWQTQTQMFSIGNDAHFKCWDAAVTSNVADCSVSGKSGILGNAPDASMICVCYDESIGVLYTGGDTGAIYMWSAEKCVHSIETAHQGKLSALVCDSSDNSVFTGGGDGIIRHWNWVSKPDSINEEECKAKFNQQAIAFDLWDIFTANKELRLQLGITDGFSKPILKALERFYALFKHRRIDHSFIIPEDPQWDKELWGEDLSLLQRPRSLEVKDMALLESGELIFATLGGIVAGLVPETRVVRVLSVAHSLGSIRSVTPHPTNSALVYTVGDDKCLSVWNTTEQKSVVSRPLRYPASAVSASPEGIGGVDGNVHVAVGFTHGAITVFDVNNGYAILKTFQTTEEQVSVMKYSPNGSFLAAGNNENTIYVFDTSREYRLHCRCAGHTSFITGLDWSTGSDILRTNCAANELLFWDILRKGCQIREKHAASIDWSTESLIISFTTMGIFENGDTSDQYNGVDTSKDRDCIVVCDDDGCVKLFNYPCVVKGAPYKERGAHCSHVSGVCFVADDSYVVSVGAKDRGVFLWKVLERGQELNDGKCANTFGWEEEDYANFREDAVAEGAPDFGPDEDVASIVPVSCEHCGRQFRPESLLKHQETCTAINPYASVMGKEFREVMRESFEARGKRGMMPKRLCSASSSDSPFLLPLQNQPKKLSRPDFDELDLKFLDTWSALPSAEQATVARRFFSRFRNLVFDEDTKQFASIEVWPDAFKSKASNRTALASHATAVKIKSKEASRRIFARQHEVLRSPGAEYEFRRRSDARVWVSSSRFPPDYESSATAGQSGDAGLSQTAPRVSNVVAHTSVSATGIDVSISDI